MAKSSSLKSTLAVSLNNYLDAGAIVAGASGLTLWQNYLGLSAKILKIHLSTYDFSKNFMYFLWSRKKVLTL